MPSPVSHLTMGYVLYRVFGTRLPQEGSGSFGPLPKLLIITGTLSLLPDIDVIPGVIFGDIGRFHNNVMNSLIFGLGFALLVAGSVWLTGRGKPGFWFLVVLVSYWLHILMDFLTVGRGVMALWPFTPERYKPPLYVFYGLHWSDGWISIRHLWTILSEMALVLVVGLGLLALSRRRNS